MFKLVANDKAVAIMPCGKQSGGTDSSIPSSFSVKIYDCPGTSQIRFPDECTSRLIRNN